MTEVHVMNLIKNNGGVKQLYHLSALTEGRVAELN